MSAHRFLVLNGPNLAALGHRQPEIYGNAGMDCVPDLVRQLVHPADGDIELVFFQSNSEGELIDRLEKARSESMDGVIFNAGAYTHTSLALADCLAWIKLPCVEVHISNVFARTADPIRQQSYLARHCIGVVAGFGLTSYALAVQALLFHKKSQQS